MWRSACCNSKLSLYQWTVWPPRIGTLPWTQQQQHIASTTSDCILWKYRDCTVTKINLNFYLEPCSLTRLRHSCFLKRKASKNQKIWNRLQLRNLKRREEGSPCGLLRCPAWRCWSDQRESCRTISCFGCSEELERRVGAGSHCEGPRWSSAWSETSARRPENDFEILFLDALNAPTRRYYKNFSK